MKINTATRDLIGFSIWDVLIKGLKEKAVRNLIAKIIFITLFSWLFDT
jgi:hypothetical protein